MSGTRISKITVKQIIELSNLGVTKAAIGRRFGLSRNTIAAVMSRQAHYLKKKDK